MIEFNKDLVFGAILGVAVGDALGVPAEFSERDTLKNKPVEGMEGYGAHNQPPGTWSDDTSLTLCLIDSLCNGYNLNDLAAKFLLWYNEGLWTPHGEAFDIGDTTLYSLENLSMGISPRVSGGNDEYDNGNGSLMRIAPLIFYTYHLDLIERFKIVHEVSSITHAHPRALIACDYYVQYGIDLLNGKSKEEAYFHTNEIITEFFKEMPDFKQELKHYRRILEGNVWELPEQDIISHGYVVYTLEGALWSFIPTNNFKEAVLKAVNLGHDTDTFGAVTGGLAGLYYGYESIPEEWLNVLAKRENIENLLNKFYLFLTK